MEEYEKPVVCSFLAVKGSFHLRSDMIADELSPKDDLRKVEERLNSLPLDTMPNRINFYAARYYHTLYDLHVWKRQYPKTMHYLQKAIKLYTETKLLRCSVSYSATQVARKTNRR